MLRTTAEVETFRLYARLSTLQPLAGIASLTMGEHAMLVCPQRTALIRANQPPEICKMQYWPSPSGGGFFDTTKLHDWNWTRVQKTLKTQCGCLLKGRPMNKIILSFALISTLTGGSASYALADGYGGAGGDHTGLYAAVSISILFTVRVMMA